MRIFENPALKITSGFLCIIFLGSFLLSFDFMRNSNIPYSFINTLFTVVSSVCVTGLSTVNIGEYFSIYGQILILILIQIGGLGYMTIAVTLLAIIRKKLTIVEKLATQSSIGKLTMGGLVEFVLYILKITLTIEIAGTILLTIAWYPIFGSKSIFYALFHSVSAFCNSGFSLFSDSIARFQHNNFVILIFIILIVLGGIGFIVLNDFIKYIKKRKITYHTKLVLVCSACLIFIPSIIFFFTEYNNPLTLGKFDFLNKIFISIFHSVTTRTAGFNIVNIKNCLNINIFLFLILMFIGASPAGTGGGIKTTTFVVLLKSFTSMFSGKKNVNIFKRKIETKTIEKSWILFFSGLIISLTFIALMFIFEKFSFKEIIFEVISAFGTVGLSFGITPYLTLFSKSSIILLMFIGRVGTLLIASGMFIKHQNLNYQYPEEKILIG
jgi:trk system potassium uptake protein TrkH